MYSLKRCLTWERPAMSMSPGFLLKPQTRVILLLFCHYFFYGPVSSPGGPSIAWKSCLLYKGFISLDLLMPRTTT